MSKPRVVNLEQVEWQPHPTLAGVRTRIIENGASNPQANVLVANVNPDGGIPWHVHEQSVEIAYVLAGTGTFFYDEHGKGETPVETGIQAGCVLSIPAGLWHAVANTGSEPLLLYAFHTPPIF